MLPLEHCSKKGGEQRGISLTSHHPGVSLTHRKNGEENTFKQTASEPIKSVTFLRMCVSVCAFVRLCDSKHDKDPDAAYLPFVLPSHPEPTSTTVRR